MELSEGLHLCLKLKDMEIKDNKFIIDIPKSMEVDVKNTDLTKGIVKFKPKNITYNDVEIALNLPSDNTCMYVHRDNLPKLSAISELMNIAKYYNGDWKPEWNNRDEDKNYIYYSYTQNEYYVDAVNTYTPSIVYFKNLADAQAVIDNPNFRQILDAIYKD